MIISNYFLQLFGRNRYVRILFIAVLTCDIFHRNIDRLCKEILNKFGIFEDILIVKYDGDGSDNHRKLHRVLQFWRKESLRLNTLNGYRDVPHFGGII